MAIKSHTVNRSTKINFVVFALAACCLLLLAAPARADSQAALLAELRAGPLEGLAEGELVLGDTQEATLETMRTGGGRGRDHVVEVEGMPFSKAYETRVVQAADAGPWGVQYQAHYQREINEGDVIFVHFYARAAEVEGDRTEGAMDLDTNLGWRQTLNLGQEWQRYMFGVMANKSVEPGDDTARMDGFIAQHGQRLQIGGMLVLNLGSNAHLNRLPDELFGGNFRLIKHAIDSEINEADGQSLADVDGDGQNNIIVGTGGGGQVFWYEKHSPSEWTRHLIAEGLIEVEGTIAADFNNDGQIEVIILDQASRNPSRPNVHIAKQNTDDPRQEWSGVVLDPDAPHVQQGIAFDVSGNGFKDFVYAFEGVRDGEGGFYWMENKGGNPLDPDNWVRHEIDQIEGAWWIDYNSPKDFNGNGIKGDILVGARAGRRAPPAATGGTFIYLRPEDPTQRWERVTVDDTYPPLHVSSGDLTGNGDDRDVVAAASQDSSQSGLFIYDFSRDWERIRVDGGRRWWGTYAFDITGDGRAEIISGAQWNDMIRIYAWDEKEERYTRRSSTPFRKPDDQIIFDDITGDGRVREFFVGSDPDGLFWFQIIHE